MTAPPTDAAPQRRPGRLLAVLSGLLGVAMLGAMGWGLWVGAGAAWGWFDRPLPDPFEPVERFSADWWLAPVERNAFRRLPVLGTHVNDIAVAGDGETLWAVGERGAIFHSADGGRSWASQAEHIDWSGELPAPAAAGAAGRSGALLISQALAQESSPEAKAPDPQTASKQPSDPPREPIPTPQPQRVPEKSLAPPAVPAPDTRADEPPTPPDEALPEPHPDLNAVQFLADGRRGWAVGDKGSVLATDDAGHSWQPQDSGTQASLTAVQFLADGRRGWAVGGEGSVLATGDGGQSWQPQDSGTQARLLDVQFLAEGRRGWTVGDNGTVLASADGGQSWRRQDSGTPARLWEVHFLVDGRRGWAVGDNGTVLATGDGGQTWTDPVQYAAYPPRVLWVVAGALLVAIGWVGLRQPAAGPATAGRTAPAGNAEPDTKLGDVQVKAARSAETADEIPARQSAPPAQPSIAEEGVSDRPVGWDDPDYLGFKPIVRGLSRMLRNARTEPPLTIAFTGPWGSGKSSLMNLLQEELRGWGYRPVWFNVWHHQEEHHMLAALMEAINRQLVPSALTPDGLALRWRMLRQRGKAYWLWILLLLVTLASFTWLAASERPVVLTEASVTDIAGEIWGEETACPAGDASDASDVPPLLGSLCALRHQQFESSRGLIDAVEAGVAGAGGNAFVLTRERRTLIRERAEHLEHPLDSLPATLGGSVTALVTVFSLLSGSRFLGLTPLQLLQSLVGFAGVRRFREETGFRQRFATEFRLVSRALPPHTHLTLILDDLDRCTPDNVVATLETVNLLVSAAPCYVMLGMDRDWVRACVSLRYEEIARELAAQEHRPAGDGEAETYTFAQRYLEKLINLEVPVPRPSSEQTRRLLGWQRRDRRPQLQWRRRRLLLRRLRRKRDRPALTRRVIIWAGAARALAATRWAAWLLRPRAALAAGVVLIAAAGWQQGWPPPFAAPSNDGARMTTRAAPLADPGAKPGTQPAPASGPERPTDERPAVDLRAGGAGEFRPGGQPDTSAWWWLPGGLALVLAALVAGQRRWREIADRLPAIRRVERDTPEFARALDIWHPVVVALPHNNTPRAVKRFKNRVRYFAVRQRDLPAPRNLLERFLEPARRWMRPRYGAFADAEPIPEPLLVALGAIHHCDPRCLDTQESFEAVLARQPAAAAGDGDTRSAETATIPGAHEAMRRAVQESIEAQQEHFPGTWPPADAQRRQFLAMTARLRAD